MGAVNFSIDDSLLSMMREVLHLYAFVETGTFEGESVQRALPFFEEIHSVELSEIYFKKAVQRFENEKNVHLYHDDSVRFLKQVQQALKDKAVLYWLDAHWCSADETAGGTSQCPVLEELDAISRLGAESVILIDDARLFLCPPPPPHTVEDWPRFDALVRKLFLISSVHELMVVNDVLICFPRSIREHVEKYAREHSIDWLSVLDKSRDYDTFRIELGEKEEEINRLAAAARERERALTEKENEIGTLAQAIREQNEVLLERDALLKTNARQAAEAMKGQKGPGLASVIQEMETALKEKEKEIRTISEARRKQDAVLVERDKLLKQMEKSLKEKEKEIGTISEARREQDAVLVERDQLLKEISREAELRLSEMEKMAKVVEEQRREIQLLRAAAEDLERSPDGEGIGDVKNISGQTKSEQGPRSAPSTRRGS